jgi:hypothetical protein
MSTIVPSLNAATPLAVIVKRHLQQAVIGAQVESLRILQRKRIVMMRAMMERGHPVRLSAKREQPVSEEALR